MSARVWKGVNDHGWKGSIIVWLTGKVGILKYALVCVYASVNVRMKKGRCVIRTFWDELSEFVGSFESGRKVIQY